MTEYNKTIREKGSETVAMRRGEGKKGKERKWEEISG